MVMLLYFVCNVLLGGLTTVDISRLSVDIGSKKLPSSSKCLLSFPADRKQCQDVVCMQALQLEGKEASDI